MNCGSQARVGTSWHSSMVAVVLACQGQGLRPQRNQGHWFDEQRVAGDELEGSILQLRANS